MSIAYPLSLPSVLSPKRVNIRTLTQVAYARSIFTGRAQVHLHQGQLWVFDVSLPIMTRAQAEEWNSFLLKLNGPYGTFLMGDPAGKTPRGIASGTPLVKGANQIGQSLETDGWSASVTGILKAGDYIQIGNRLYKNLNDVNSDGSGNATLDIYPRLREIPADNAPITTTNTKGTFRLSSNDLAVCNIDTDKTYDVSFTAVEDVSYPYD